MRSSCLPGQDSQGCDPQLHRSTHPDDTNSPTLFCSNVEAYGEDIDTLGDGVGLLHVLCNAGHDDGAVVAGPVAEDALDLAEAKALASIAGTDDVSVEAVCCVTPPLDKCLKRKKAELQKFSCMKLISNTLSQFWKCCRSHNFGADFFSQTCCR